MKARKKTPTRKPVPKPGILGKAPGSRSKSSDAELLEGGGRMGDLIRSFSWETTPLGPQKVWSPALKTTVGMILRAKFPFILWWGVDFIQF